MSRARGVGVGRANSRVLHRHELTSDAYHYRPQVEPLEQRRLLATVTGVSPAEGSHDAPVTTDISAVFDSQISPATVSVQTFAVHGMQTGQLLDPPHAIGVTGDTITLSPAAPFHPGELVRITATAGIESSAGNAAAAYGWQFRTATTSGEALFVDSGQTLSVFDSRVVTLGDLDGDGDLDAFVGNRDAPTTVWLNDGRGTFTDSGQRLAGGSNFTSMALGDLDGDGDLDAVIGNDGAPNKVWLNDGSGSFSDYGQSLGNSDSRAVALGDMDGDGDLDAFVGNDDPEPNKVWLNDGSGNFTDSGQSLGNSDSRAVALGDMDGDGDLDAFVGNDSGPNKVWLNDGSGSFSDYGQSLGNSDSRAVALGDMDGDGDLDAFVGNENQSNRVWLNDGSGSFSDYGQSLGNSDSRAVALGDMDGDGDLDAFVGNENQSNRVWLNDGSGTFSHSGQSLGNSASFAVALGDMDGDGDLDAFVGNENQSNRVWLNTAASELVDLSATNTDGQLDVVLGQTLTYTITVTNKGPRDVVGAVVTDDFPALLTDINWTCAASPGSTCPISGTGDIHEAIDLRVGGTVVFSVLATVDSAAIWPTNVFASVATVTAPEGLVDLSPHNNTAIDTNRLSEEPRPDDLGGASYFPPLEFAAGDEPVWVTHGDVNGDIALDLIVANRQSRDVSILLGDGNGDFAVDPVLQFDVGLSPSHVATGDLDGDGQLDLIVVGGSRVAVLLNEGRLQESWLGFAGPILYTTGNDPNSAVVRDLDGDGNLDLVLASSQSVSVHLGSGDGTFQAAVTYTAGTGRRSVTAGDFNGDGVVDLVVGNEEASDISVLLGEGDGTFEEQAQTYPVQFEGPQSVVTGDIDGDGDLDLGIAYNGSHLSVMRGRGDGTFEPEQLIDSISAPFRSLAFGDVDADGDLDLAVAYGWEYHCELGGLAVLAGNGDGTFEPPIRVGLEDGAVSIADFDANGRLDLASSTETGVSLNLGTRDAIFAPETLDHHPLQPSLASIVSNDLNGDDHPDLLLANGESNDLSVLLGHGDGTFSSQVRYTVGHNPTSILSDDVNGDGHPDLLSANGESNDVSVLLGNGDGTFLSQIRYAVGREPTSIVCDDLNGDGHKDLLSANGRSHDVSVLLGHGDGTFSPQVRYAVGHNPTSILSDDVNGDGHPDLLLANHDSHNVSVLLGNGDGTFLPQIRYAVGHEPTSIVCDDLNGDGHPDIVSINHGSDDLSVLLGNGDGTFSPQVRYAVGDDPTSILSEDLNGDGHPDLLSANHGSDDLSVLLGNGDGTFSPGVSHPVAPAPESVVLGDLDGDADLDVAVAGCVGGKWGGSLGSLSFLLSHGDGFFDPAVIRYLPDGVGSVIAEDLDADNDFDLVLAGSDSLNVLENTTADLAPLPGDFDGDRDVDGDDFLAWQAGFGTQSGASLSDGDADRDGDVDGDDFLVWQMEFGSGAAATGAGSVVAPTAAPVVLSPPARGRVLSSGIPTRGHILRTHVFDRDIAELGLRNRAATHAAKLKISVLGDDLLDDLATTLAELGISTDYA